MREQVPPNETVDAVTEAMLTASRLLVSLSARSIAAVDDSITIGQFRMMVILEHVGQVNLGALASRLGVQRSTATRMVDRLVAAGLVDRAPSSKSRREVMVELTVQGREVVRQVTAGRRREIDAVVAHMPPEQRAGLVRALTAFTEAGGEPSVAYLPDTYWL